MRLLLVQSESTAHPTGSTLSEEVDRRAAPPYVDLMGEVSKMQRPPFLDGILERTATRFLRSIHRITHRMPVKLRAIEKQRVLVVAPHPDDEVIAVGGNLALHQRLGSEVLTLFVTLDAPAADVGRKGEAERVARLLGFDHRFLGFPDGSISLHEPAARSRDRRRDPLVPPGGHLLPLPGRSPPGPPVHIGVHRSGRGGDGLRG